jgi:hypothetical protein
LAGKGTGDDFDDGARESKGGQTGSCAVGLQSEGAERKGATVTEAQALGLLFGVLL